ncbi:hypothetical protein RRG08_039704 [Elysia crispata]|uniref:Secreted protein n=1 Tax=Elysia crispata TaxID=231223 RepID=A0AAE0YAC1_9GAST|nr:hypothetical protein RRG08_039704 [Elysia crispata]
MKRNFGVVKFKKILLASAFSFYCSQLEDTEQASSPSCCLRFEESRINLRALPPSLHRKRYLVLLMASEYLIGRRFRLNIAYLIVRKTKRI